MYIWCVRIQNICSHPKRTNALIQLLKGIPVIKDRVYRPLENIKDNYPKYVLTLDYLLQQRNGIKHENIIKFILDNKNFI